MNWAYAPQFLSEALFVDHFGNVHSKTEVHKLRTIKTEKLKKYIFGNNIAFTSNFL